eukprot:5195764-Lingulodinium_polyedra.AAC.1
MTPSNRKGGNGPECVPRDVCWLALAPGARSRVPQRARGVVARLVEAIGQRGPVGNARQRAREECRAS